MAESLRILILEDNPADAELVQFELQEAGIVFTAKVVMTEKDFIRELLEFSPDIILSDYDLPKYSGALALAEARKKCPDTPFILVTGAVTEDRAIEILTQGAKDYVLKSRLQQRLAPAVRRALAEAEEHRARKQAEEELRESHRTLEEKVKARTAELTEEMAARKKTQDELKDSEKRYRRLFEASKDGILILDAQTGKVDDVNPFLLQLLGYSYDELYGKYIWEIGVFKDIAASKEAFQTLQDNEYIRYEDLPLETRNGQSIAVEFVSNVYLVDHHKVIQCNIRDITEHKLVEAKLQRSAAMLESIGNNTPDSIFVKDFEGRMLYASPGTLRALNKTAEQILGRIDTEWHPNPEEAKVLMANDRRVMESGQTLVTEEAFTDAQGMHTFLSTKSPLLNSTGQVIGLVGLSSDITERKKAEDTLRESEARFRTMANSIPQLAWIARADGFIFWYNQRWYDYTGTTSEQMEGWGWQSVHDPMVLPEVMERWKMAIATGEPFDMEFPLLGADKIFRPFLTRVLPLKNEQGHVIQWFGTNTDLTERKRAEEELALNEREFRLLAESMPQIVWTTRADGWNTYFNQKWVDYTGLTLEESYGHGWNKPFHPDDQQRSWDAWQNAVSHNAPYLLQCRLRRADGIYRWWLIHGVPVLDENGNIIKWYGTCTDINDLKQAEEAMLPSQNQFNLLILNIKSGVALIDDTGKFTVVNPSFLRMFGLKDDETIINVNDKNWSDWQVFESDGTLLHVDEHPVRKAAITGKPVKDKLIGVRLPSGGDLIWMLVSANLVHGPDGSIQSTICTYYDITELKRAEEILKESEQKYRSIFENSLDAIFLAIPNVQVLAANPAACAIFGMTEEELCRVGRRGIEDPTDPRHAAAVEERARTGKVKYEATHVRRNGSTFPSEVSSVIMDGGLRSLVILRDITARKRAEQELRESEEKFRNLFMNMTEEVHFWKLIRDEQGRIKTWQVMDINPPTVKAWGRESREDTIGRTADEIFPGATEHFMPIIQQIMAEGIPYSYENYFPPPVDKYFRFTSIPLGEYFFTTGADVTRSRKAEESLKQQAKELEDANKELESFSYSVSHDLKAPLRAIDGYSRMLLKKDVDKLSEDTIRKLDVIRSNAEKMNSLIDDLLSFSKVLSRGIAISEINMDKLAREVWAEIQAANTERELELRITSMLPGNGDPTLIRQVLFNLISNAVKFTKTRKPGIIEIDCYSEKGNAIYFIKDNGVGFDMAYYDKLFGVFQRLHSHEEYEGTGVGLSIVQRIIVRHGGRVWAEGDVNKGATFYFTLPISS